MDPHELYGDSSDAESVLSDSESEDELPEKGWYIRNYGHLMLRDIVFYKVLQSTKEKAPKKRENPTVRADGYRILWEYFSDFLAETDVAPEKDIDAKDADPEKLQEELEDYIEERRRVDLAVKTRLKAKKYKQLDITDDIINFEHSLDGVDKRLRDRLRGIWGTDISEFICLPKGFDYNQALTAFQTMTETLGLLQKQAGKVDKDMKNLGQKMDLLDQFEHLLKSCGFEESFDQTVKERTHNEVASKLDLEKIEENVTVLRKLLVTLQYLGPFISEIDRLREAVEDFSEFLNIEDILTTRKSIINASKAKPIKRVNLGETAGMTPIPLVKRRNPLSLQGGAGAPTEEVEHPSGHEFVEKTNETSKKLPFEA